MYIHFVDLILKLGLYLKNKNCLDKTQTGSNNLREKITKITKQEP